MRIFCKLEIFCLFILFGVNQNSNAQNGSLRFEHIGIEEGLSNNNVTAILQDTKGYIWFGTMDGLNKYDGYSFKRYQFDPFDSNSLSQNTIYTIFEDSYGFIWVGTYEGLCRFDRSTEKFSRFKPTPGAKFSDPNISAVSEDSDGMIWAGSFTGGLCRLDRQKGIFLPEHFEIMGVRCMYKDKTGVLWVGGSTGLHKINLMAKKGGKPADVNFTHHGYDFSNPDSLSSNLVTSIFEDHEGIMWLATDNGLNSFDKRTGKFKRYLNDPKNSHSISANNLGRWLGTSIQEDPEGNLWIATDKGLNKLSRDRRVFTTFLHNSKDASSLSSDAVSALRVDKAGILYTGTREGKLDKANLNPKPFELRRNEPNNINSLSSNKIAAMLEDASGIIWIGTCGGGLNRWNRRTNQFTEFRRNLADPRMLTSDTVMALLEDRHGHLWVCNGDVLSKWSTQSGEFIHYDSKDKNFKEVHKPYIISISEDHDGYLWLGTGSGIKRFDEKTGEFWHKRYNPDDTNGPGDYTAITIFADSRDNIWIGHGSRATDKYDKRTGKFNHYKHDPKDSASISSSVVCGFFEDAQGLWLGTLSGGLCHFDYKTEKFRTYTDKHGLPANNVYSILTDNKNNLWLGTSNGLSRFDPIIKTFTNYDYRDGLQSNVFVATDNTNLSKGGCFKASDGTLYFGGNNGFNFFDPEQLKPDSQIAPVVITQFKLFDQLVKGAHESKEIVLKYDQNYFSFEFASLSFYNPSKNQYKYKLEGVDKDWVNSGPRHYVGYTNIDPGTYTFKVKGTNNDGVWNENGTSIIIIIKPPWWNTWLFKIVAALCLIALFYGIIRWRIQQKFRVQLIRSEKDKQVAELQQQKTELEMQALRAQMNPHFIFNSLNSINRFILQNNKAQASEYLTKFSRLVRLILQNSQASLITLESELESLELYLELEELRFEHRFAYKIFVPKDLDIDVLKVPPLIIQPYAENAIWHGLMHKEEKGHLDIEVSQENDQLLFKVSDDGVGRKQAAAFNSKSATKHKSVGLKITSERIAMMQTETGNGSAVTINDLVNPDGSAAGTEVMIKIPALYE